MLKRKRIKNRTIWTGNNLPIMKGMDSNSIDLIYLDPPFNKNRNFAAPIGSKAAGAAFKDTWTLDDVDLKWHAEVDEENHALYTIIDAAGQAWHKSMKAYLTYMAIRLIEMKRILKDTGSIYLHCDPTASHYLKMVMDCIFGKENFRNEIIWGYKTGGVPRESGRFARKHDCLLFYCKDAKQLKFNQLKEGSYTRTLPEPHTTSGKNLGVRRDNIGKYRQVAMRDWCVEYGLNKEWDITPLYRNNPERTGYPTQKPLALLERIIKTSSDKDDVVLDPFCGCATACIAAERNDRKWIGIDISGKAVELVKSRMERELGLFYDVDHRTDFMEPASIEERSDKEIQTPYNSKEIKQILFFKQDARCAICGHSPGVKMMDVDHIVPVSRGGMDDIENLQLLCRPCNQQKSAKGDQEFREWKANEAITQLAASFSKNNADAQSELEDAFRRIVKMVAPQ